MASSPAVLVADQYVAARWGAEWQVGRVYTVDTPAGLLCWVRLRDGGETLDGPTPFFVGDDGQVFQFVDTTLQLVMRRLMTSRSPDRDIVRSYFDLGDQRDDSVLSEFVRGCLDTQARE